MGNRNRFSIVPGSDFLWGAFSEKGARSQNEDRWGFRVGAGGGRIWVIADGLGGHASGDIAAEVAVDAFLNAAAIDCPPIAAVQSGLVAARSAVAALGRLAANAKDAPSSTIVALVERNGEAYCCHVGDSTLYQFRDGRLLFRSQPHNVRELMRGVSDGPSGTKPSDDPDSSRLTRSLSEALEEGQSDAISSISLKAGDLLVLCSDGVSNHIPEDGISDWLAGVDEQPQLSELLERTVESAADPRQDNFTAISVSVVRIPLFGENFRLFRRLPVWLWACLTLFSIAIAAILAWQLASSRQPSVGGAQPQPVALQSILQPAAPDALASSPNGASAPIQEMEQPKAHAEGAERVQQCAVSLYSHEGHWSPSQGQDLPNGEIHADCRAESQASYLADARQRCGTANVRNFKLRCQCRESPAEVRGKMLRSATTLSDMLSEKRGDGADADPSTIDQESPHPELSCQVKATWECIACAPHRSN
jgi:serine/threonine protein phosphatase PrpC